MTFVVRHGKYEPEQGLQCPRGCKSPDTLRCYPGEYPRCEECLATFISMGRVPTAPCVTPTGRIDGHMAYIKILANKVVVCSFCGRPGDLMASRRRRASGASKR